MQKDFSLPPPESPDSPAISVIIPMYNVENYIGECLDSLLAQTFRDFEIILVDDLSTDNGFEIVKSYVERFGGRLKLAQMKKNSGGASRPRNVGLQLASGEYIFFVDSDDFIMLNALETLYNAAKEYDAEVVYYAAQYDIRQPNDVYIHRDGLHEKLLKEGLEDKPTLTVDDTDKILDDFLLTPEGNLCGPCTKFIRRDFLLKHEITFPNIAIGEDFIWCINVYCHVKRFLRIPAPLYFYRRYNTESVSQTKKEPAEQISRWITQFISWLKLLSELAGKNEILSKNPDYCLAASKRHFQWSLGFMREAREQLSDEEIYELLFAEFAKENVSPDLTVPFFFSIIHADRKARANDRKEFRNVTAHFTSRIDIQLKPKTAGNLEILSVSDDKAEIWQPAWFNKDGIGYQIQSYAGNMEFIAKTTGAGKIRLNLMGTDVRDPKDNSKRIPCWIDYTKLAINGKTIFNNVIPAWHDKPYNYNLDVKAGDEIKIQVEWLPHRNASLNSTVNKLRETTEDLTLPSVADNNPAISIIIPVYNAEKFIGEALESILTQTLKNFEVIVVDDCSTDNSCEVVESYIPKFDGRLSLYHMSKNSGCAPAPRNNGFLISRGEYIFFMDSDDTFTQTALEEMYTLAKEYSADVVYCEKYYMSTGVGDDYIKNIHLADDRIQKPPFVDKPTLISDSLADRLEELFQGRFWVTPWQRLVSRKLLVDNEITFPEIIGSDDVVWCFQVLCCAKRFLRVPNMCYIRRMYEESFTQSSKKSPNRHIHQWMDIAIRGSKFVSKFMDKLKFFRENPSYRYKALNTLISPSFNVIAPVCAKLRPEEIHDIFLKEFSNDTGENNVLVAFLSAGLLNQKKYISAQKEEIKQLKSQAFLMSPLPALRSIAPAFSVIIPLYNSEEYIGECLESLLKQTLKNFEVIVVDDCSTDRSCEIVESYIPKFGGRLVLAKMNTNSGGGSLPRNKGIRLSRGEYLFFMDSDDLFTETALEDMYKPSKEFNADAGYLEKYFFYEDNGKKVSARKDRLATGKVKLELNEQLEHLKLYAADTFFWAPWTKFVKRDWAIENGVFFQDLPRAQDFLWSLKIFTFSERFLRIPAPVYFYRQSPNSITRNKRSNEDMMNFWISPVIKGLKEIGDFMNGQEVFQQNPRLLYSILDFFAEVHIGRDFLKFSQEFSPHEVFENFYRGFAKELKDSDILMSYFCAYANNLLKTAMKNQKRIKELEKENLNARKE